MTNIKGQVKNTFLNILFELAFLDSSPSFSFSSTVINNLNFNDKKENMYKIVNLYIIDS